MRAWAAARVIGILGLGAAAGCGRSDEAPPAARPVVEPRPARGSSPAGSCNAIERAGTCAFVRLEEPGVTSDGLLVTARYRIVQSEPRSTEGDPRELTHQLRVYPDRLEALRAHLGAQSEVACRYWETSGGCPERPPIIDLPPFDFGQPPVPPFDTMPEAWPQRICALETSGVPTALRVELSNCGERVVCRVREGRGPIALEVRTDPSTMPACISAIRASASCAVLRPLAAGQQTVRVNDRVSMQVDTDASGALPPGRCWDVPAPPAARRGPRRAP